MTPPVCSPGELVADTDRDSAIDDLRGHMLAGRLTVEEFEVRVGAAHSAKTRADLDVIRFDLPPAAVADLAVRNGRLSDSAPA
jgi:hypothetical protein